MASCVGPSNRYTVKINRTITPVNGERIYITTLFGDAIDSTKVDKGKIYFEGEIEEPTAVCLYSNTGTMPILLPFILEQGNITIDYDENQIKGTQLNNLLNRYMKEVHDLMLAEDDEDVVFNKIIASSKALFDANTDNQLAIIALTSLQNMLPIPDDPTSDYSAKDLEESLNRIDNSLKEEEVVKDIFKLLSTIKSTQEGEMFVDIDFDTVNGKVENRLSDYVGKGKYVLVDFWSEVYNHEPNKWEVLEEVSNLYSDANFDVLGVKLFGATNNFTQIVKNESPGWINMSATQNPTDVINTYYMDSYGEYILFAPDGTILKRDIHLDNLEEVISGVLRQKV